MKVVKLAEEGLDGVEPHRRAGSPTPLHGAFQYRVIPGSTDGLKVVDLATGVSQVITTEGLDPRWSPAGAKISFTRYDGIWTIAPSGTGAIRILATSGQYRVEAGRWSPTGSHITYWRYSSCGFACFTGDVYRATETGASTANLTGDVSANATPADWR